jgi:hypothetical protein
MTFSLSTNTFPLHFSRVIVSKKECIHTEFYEIWCWRKIQKTSWPDRMKNEAVLWTVTDRGNMYHTVIWRKANSSGHILHRNCLLKHVFEGNIEGRTELTRIWGRRRKQLLQDLKKGENTRSHCAGNSLRKRLWACRETDCGMKGDA